MSISIDPRAAVSPKARLGTNVSVGPFTIVEDGAVIGDGTTVGGNALIGLGARIGKDCRIHHGAVIGHAPQDLKYANEPTTCEIGDRTTVREYAVLHRGTGEVGRTIIGSDCFLMAFSHVAHDCVLGNHVILSNAAMLAGHVNVEDWVTIGGITPVHQFVSHRAARDDRRGPSRTERYPPVRPCWGRACGVRGAELHRPEASRILPRGDRRA